MGSFEWMEVETLSTEITALESRLAAAKSRHNYGLVKVVKEQIDAAQQRRARYLAHITTSLAESLDPAAPAETAPEKPPRQRGTAQKNPEEIAAPDQPEAALADPVATAIEEELAELGQSGALLAAPVADDASEEPADPIMPEVPAALAEPDQTIIEPAGPIAAAPDADTIEGVTDLWDRLTPGHIERAKHELGNHRAEMLARHAEELKALEADQSEIDALAQAIDAFVRKFNAPSAAPVVRLERTA